MASLLPETPLPLLDRWIPFLPDTLRVTEECPIIIKAKTLVTAPVIKPEVDLRYASIFGFMFFSKW